mgnify:CR=1 FL=1
MEATATDVAVETFEFVGAVADALFERLVGGFERLLRIDLRRHVGIGRDDAAVGHGGRTDFDHARRREQPDAHRAAFVQQEIDARRHEIVADALAVETALRVEADDLGEIDADILILWFGTQEQADAVGNLPTMGGVSAFANGAYVPIVGETDVMAVSAPSPLSIPYIIDTYVPQLAAAADKVPTA